MKRTRQQPTGAQLDAAAASQFRPGLARRIRQLRKNAGVSQTELATKLNTTSDALSRLERGVAVPSFGRLVRIANTLSVPLSAFFEEETTDERRQIESAVCELVEQLPQESWPIIFEFARRMVDVGTPPQADSERESGGSQPPPEEPTSDARDQDHVRETAIQRPRTKEEEQRARDKKLDEVRARYAGRPKPPTDE